MPKKVARFEQADYGIKGEAMFDIVAVLGNNRRYIQVKNTEFASTGKINNANEKWMNHYGHGFMSAELWHIKGRRVIIWRTLLRDGKAYTLEMSNEVFFKNSRLWTDTTTQTTSAGG